MNKNIFIGGIITPIVLLIATLFTLRSIGGSVENVLWSMGLTILAALFCATALYFTFEGIVSRYFEKVGRAINHFRKSRTKKKGDPMKKSIAMEQFKNVALQCCKKGWSALIFAKNIALQCLKAIRTVFKAAGRMIPRKIGFGQIIALFIIAIPLVIFTVILFGIRSAMGAGPGLISLVALWVLGTLFFGAVVYFTTRLIWKHRSKATGVLGGINSEVPKGIFAFIGKWLGKWWDGLDTESSKGQKFVLFTIALICGYTEFHFFSSAWSLLLIILIGALIKPPKGWVGITFVTIDCIVLILAMFFPGFAEMRETSLKIADMKFNQASKGMTQYASRLESCNKTPESKAKCDNDDKMKEVELEMAKRPQVTRPALQRTPQVIHLMPGWTNFQKVEIPRNAKIVEAVEWSCPEGCIVEVEHDVDRICSLGNDTESEWGRLWFLGSFQEAKCRVATVPGTPGVLRYREQFLAPPGATHKNFDLPENLIHFSISFGTNEKMGPRDIVATAVTSQ